MPFKDQVTSTIIGFYMSPALLFMQFIVFFRKINILTKVSEYNDWNYTWHWRRIFYGFQGYRYEDWCFTIFQTLMSNLWHLYVYTHFHSKNHNKRFELLFKQFTETCDWWRTRGWFIISIRKLIIFIILDFRRLKPMKSMTFYAYAKFL